MRPDNDIQAQAVPFKRRLFSPPALISVVVALALVALVATRFNQDWSATWSTIRSMDPWLYAAGFFLYYLSFAFRGLRWRMLARNARIDAAPEARLLSTAECARLIVIGWFVNSVAWLRLGDAYRAYAFSQDSRSSFSKSLGTILAERALDTATILAILAVAAVILTTTHSSTTPVYVLAATLALALALSALLLTMKYLGVRLAEMLPGRLAQAYRRFHDGTLGSFKNLPALALLGIVGWALEIARLYFVVEALGLSIGFPLLILTALGHAVLSIVPTPGGVGAVEPGVAGLLAISLARPEAVAVTLLDRSITYVGVIAVGGLAFASRQVGLGRGGGINVRRSRQQA